MTTRIFFNQQLLDAAANGDDEAVDDYLGEGADINTQNEKGQTPLILAVNGDRISTVRLLLEYEADIRIRDNYGRNAVNYAARNTRILKLLRAAPDYEEELEGRGSRVPSGETESNRQQDPRSSTTQSASQETANQQSVARASDRELPEEEAIAIVMMGVSGVGKTSFLVGMYGGMTEYGFQLHATDHDQRIDLDDKWSQLLRGENLTANNPDETEHYNLELWNSRIPLARFHWIDYAGGALSDPSNEEWVQELTHYINNANCLFVCIDGEHLRFPITEQDLIWIRNETKANLILHYIRDFSRGKHPGFLPIVITVSKYDLCLQRITPESKIERIKKIENQQEKELKKNLSDREKPKIEKKAGDELQKELQKQIENEIISIFEPLFEQGWLVMICPFTLGQDFDLTRTHKGYIPTIVPRNYHFPLVFALWAKLREEAWSITKQLEEIDDYLDNVVNEGQLRSLNDSRELLEEKLEEIISIVNRELIPYLKGSPIYKDGNLVELSELPR